MRRSTVWLIGLLGIVVLWGGAVAFKARPIERQIVVSAVNELKRRSLDRRFEALSIQIDGRDLTLIGNALSEEDRAGALAVAATTPGVARVIDRITVTPEVKPFVFRVVRNADGSAALSGVAPTPDAMDRLVATGRGLLGRNVNVTLRLARGAPAGDWFAAARLAIEMAALLEQGEAVLTDKRLTLTGRAPDDAALDAAKLALSRSLPAGFESSVEIHTALDSGLRGGTTAVPKECQALVDSVMAGQAIRFAAASAALEAAPPRLFERLALAVQRCPSLYILIFAASDTHAGDPSVNLRLSEARARTLAEELVKRGIPRDRLAVQARPRGDPRERAAGPDVEFRVSDSAVPIVRPFVWNFEKNEDGSGVISGHYPSREAESALAAATRSALRGPLTDNSRLAQGAPAGDWLAAARLAIEAIGRLESGIAGLTDHELLLRGVAKDDETAQAVEAALIDRVPKGFIAKPWITTVLDEELKGGAIESAERCQALYDSVTRTGMPEFVFDGPALLGHQRRLFERLAAAARRCQRFTLEIGAHTGGTGDPDAARALSERWAQAVSEAMARAGADGARLRAVGFGNARPVTDNATEAGRLRNRRIVFRIVS